MPFQDIATTLFALQREVLFDGDIETLFLPEQYLVSPFNSTVEFLDGKYFLNNQQQEKICMMFLNLLKNYIKRQVL